MADRKKSADKPLARVGGKVSAKIYRGRLTAAEHVKYLNLTALKKAKRAVVEIGSVKAAGRTVPLVAEVRNGMAVGLRPTHCAECAPVRGKGTSTASARAQAAKAALRKVGELGLRPLRLPVPVARLFGGFGGTVFGTTITIIVDWETCIVIEFDDGSVCYICTRTPSFCIN